MTRRTVWTRCAALLMLGAAMSAHGQDLEPRSYVNTPVGLNFVVAGYGYTTGDIVFSAAVPLEDAQIETHAGVIAYLRSVDVWGLSGKVGLIVPFAEASGSAKLAGARRDRRVFGLADPTLRFSVNLYGAPALSLAEFAGYDQDLVVGATISVSPPLGQYDADKLVNIGTNRWAFEPEIGVSKHLGRRVTAELSAAASFYTPNDDFLDGKRLDLAPVYSVQAHLVYELALGLWAALDATYYGGGRPTTDGEEGDVLGNARLGLTVSLPVNRHNSMKLYGSTDLYSRTGTEFDALGIAWQVRWGGGL